MKVIHYDSKKIICGCDEAGRGALAGPVVAAAVIGGVSLKGGEGSLIGALAGVLLLAIINNALNLMSVDPYWVNAVRGFIILLALIIDAQKQRFLNRM